MNDETVASLFDGYTLEEISRWCLVSRKTASAWKAGRKRPSQRAVKLFVLHANGKVLDAWPGWTVRGDTLYDPANQPMRRQNMEAHVIIYQLAAYCRRHHSQPEGSERRRRTGQSSSPKKQKPPENRGLKRILQGFY